MAVTMKRMLVAVVLVTCAVAAQAQQPGPVRAIDLAERMAAKKLRVVNR